MMEPLISIQIQDDRPFLNPGDTIACDYQIDAVEASDIQAVEASVLWYTEGKGDEDMGVHYFERRVPTETEEDLRKWRRFQTILPNSPLSFDGELIQIRWCVRVRAFLKLGKQSSFELPFQLGDVESPNG
ncbi:MAG: hypothetical protein P8N76_20445 [Pirellulaceae bacterium]|nr:hypothetical protein [Pirellulaceae bacterium]